MSRIRQTFDQLRARGRTALVPFITAGDPEPAVTVPLMHAMVEAGADLIELGVPFSDPMADGPVIQAASERALVHGVGLHDVLDMVRSFRRRDAHTPVVLMGYLNPVEVMGYGAFAREAAEAGVDGALIVDMPPEESHGLLDALRPQGLDAIFLVAPTSTGARIERICAAASGFVYYVSLKGVTGAANLDVDAVAGKLREIRVVTDLPVGVGFGIRDARSAAQIGAVADAVIVGSALVKVVGEHVDRPQEIAPRLAEIVGGMRAALDSADIIDDGERPNRVEADR
ncbi:MAG: tryptophan synthase subunit alpha [Gammaproteobacteria bacterium]|nr:tryptophan synthase subunit alpha [Gammaproteobacteria bacterium]NIR96947.1 tryptophan synthase subunit alpha [Gammaproteobacteria bacterium]NIT62649.1 tryptophan synthase subunit alpha [Gammaproteobacteria bacterium]NIV19609.1 tryptophan synthase subunit alpha [Gammaproteobacteria bacterium]NIX10829.1 tryptophan synthase subunit alpha [Gammaproteobacteria bacterium]